MVKIYQRKFRKRTLEEVALVSEARRRIGEAKKIHLRPEACRRCNLKTKLEVHHPDYNQPLLITYLCHDCHKEADKEKKIRDLSI